MSKEDTKTKMDCRFCGNEIHEEDNFCKHCGGVGEQNSYKNQLDFELTDEDLETFIFKGFLEKTVRIGKIKDQDINVTIKTIPLKEGTAARERADKRAGRVANVSQDTYNRYLMEEELKAGLLKIGSEEVDLEEKDYPLSIMKLGYQKLQLLQAALVEVLQEGNFVNF